MDNNIPLIDNMIFAIRNNLDKFEYDFEEITSQLYKIEKLRMAKLPEKYILKSLIVDNNIIIQSIKKLNDNNVVNEIKNKIKEFEN